MTVTAPRLLLVFTFDLYDLNDRYVLSICVERFTAVTNFHFESSYVSSICTLLLHFFMPSTTLTSRPRLKLF